MAPLVHSQERGAESDPVSVNHSLGVARTQEFAHLYGSGFVVFLALPAESRARQPPRLIGQASFIHSLVDLTKRPQQLVCIASALDGEHVPYMLRSGS